MTSTSGMDRQKARRELFCERETLISCVVPSLEEEHARRPAARPRRRLSDPEARTGRNDCGPQSLSASLASQGRRAGKADEPLNVVNPLLRYLWLQARKGLPVTWHGP